jgi:TRAP-type mannitol/chloroaromatic compound transport system permease small subunit
MTTHDSTLLRIAHRLDRISLASGHVTAWLILPMVLSLTYEVGARYLFNAPTEWAYDMTFMLYGTFFMLGAAYTLQRKGHVRTDSFYTEWSPRRQALTDLVCYLLMFLPFVGVFVFVGWGYFVKAYVTPRDRSSAARGSRSPGRSSWRCRWPARCCCCRASANA